MIKTEKFEKFEIYLLVSFQKVLKFVLKDKMKDVLLVHELKFLLVEKMDLKNRK